MRLIIWFQMQKSSLKNMYNIYIYTYIYIHIYIYTYIYIYIYVLIIIVTSNRQNSLGTGILTYINSWQFYLGKLIGGLRVYGSNLMTHCN